MENNHDSLYHVNSVSLSYPERHFQKLLLEAVDRKCVESVEILLEYGELPQQIIEGDERKQKDYRRYSNSNAKVKSNKECTALIKAVQNGDAAIIKAFITRNFIITYPHSLDCTCRPCYIDPLFQSKTRIDTYKSISNPLWIWMTSDDPFLTAFKLCSNFVKLAAQEDAFEKTYKELDQRCRTFCLELLDQCQSRQEQIVLMNLGEVPNDDASDDGEQNSLKFLKLAIDCKQKEVIN